jgi:hypothetical protein
MIYDTILNGTTSLILERFVEYKSHLKQPSAFIHPHTQTNYGLKRRMVLKMTVMSALFFFSFQTEISKTLLFVESLVTLTLQSYIVSTDPSKGHLEYLASEREG